jgi:hypothetical protein
MSQRMNDHAASPAGMKALGAVYGCAYCIDMHSRDVLKAGTSLVYAGV